MSRLNQRFFSPRIWVLLFTVLVLGIVLGIDLWTVPENKTIVQTASKSELVNKDSRSPASISVVDVEKWQEPDRLVTIDWDCSQKVKSHHLKNVYQMRLNGSCLKDIKRLTNNNNGYTANIFMLNNSYTTDFLSLNEGTNKLVIEWIDGASGNLSRDLDIIVEKQ